MTDETAESNAPPKPRWWWRYDEYQCPVCGRGQGDWERTRTYKESEKGYHSHARYDYCEE